MVLGGTQTQALADSMGIAASALNHCSTQTQILKAISEKGLYQAESFEHLIEASLKKHDDDPEFLPKIQ